MTKELQDEAERLRLRQQNKTIIKSKPCELNNVWQEGQRLQQSFIKGSAVHKWDLTIYHISPKEITESRGGSPSAHNTHTYTHAHSFSLL